MKLGTKKMYHLTIALSMVASVATVTNNVKDVTPAQKVESYNVTYDNHGYEIIDDKQNEIKMLVKVAQVNVKDNYVVATNVFNKSDDSIIIDLDLFDDSQCINKVYEIVVCKDNNGDNIKSVKLFESSAYGKGILVNKQRVENYK